ncbi:MAG TPA: DUF58 domain-containing protein [Candidatus Jeotgalibaca pullicola]|nr:DUF58 domain-containing protein [Candidatus Jeotgalibaca pullicola]
MKRLAIRKIASYFLAIIFCLMLFIYTMAFPGNTSWFIFLFFLILFFILFFSTLFSWGKAEATIHTQLDQSNNFLIRLVTRSRLPVFIPELTIQLKIKNQIFEVVQSIFFKNKINAEFTDLQIPRGRYQELVVQTYGRDYFGLFLHQKRKKIALDFDIYPKLISVRYRQQYLQKLTSNAQLKQYLKSSPAQFHQIREYMPQDSLKQIDWKSSYRQQKLMTKEYEKEIQPRVSLIFYGVESLYFEELLSLFYTLYEELKLTNTTHIHLIGKIEEKIMKRTDESALLFIEPIKQSEELLSLYQNAMASQDYFIVFAPREVVPSLQNIRKEQVIYFSETELIHTEVSKDI